MEKRWGFYALFLFIISVVFLFTPGLSRAISFLDFNMDANHPPTASISYAGDNAPLIGVDISVDSVTGINTPLNSGVTVPINGALFFETGPCIGSDPTQGWAFGGGGQIALFADSTLWLFGPFVAATAIVDPTGSLFKVAIGVFFDEKNKDLTDAFGLPGGLYQGYFNLSFIADAIPPNGFQSLAVLSGDVINTPAIPEPATMLLLGSGLIGLAGYGRKKFFKK